MKTFFSGITLSIFLCARAYAAESPAPSATPPVQPKPPTPLVAPPAQARTGGSLKWEQTTIELHPKPNDKQAIAHFKYENVSKTPVHFKSVHASCGCTTTQTQHDIVNPGEKGEITATFNIGGRTGTQVKQVTVQTDEANAATTTLTLKTIIPQMLTINPTFVFWKGGEEPKPKTISLKAGADFAVKNIKVTASNPEFTTKVEPAGTGEWKVSVQPKATDKAAAGMLTIQPEVPDAPGQMFYANVSVTATPPPNGATAPAPAASTSATAPARPSPTPNAKQ